MDKAPKHLRNGLLACLLAGTSLAAWGMDIAPSEDAESVAEASQPPKAKPAGTPVIPVSVSMLDQQLAEREVVQPAAANATTPAMPVAIAAVTPAALVVTSQETPPLRKLTDMMAAPFSAALATVNSMMAHSQQMVVATADEWEDNRLHPLPVKPAPVIAEAKPQPLRAPKIPEPELPQMAMSATVQLPPAPQPIQLTAAPVPVRQAIAQPAQQQQQKTYAPDPAAAVFADNQPVMVYYPQQPQYAYYAPAPQYYYVPAPQPVQVIAQPVPVATPQPVQYTQAAPQPQPQMVPAPQPVQYVQAAPQPQSTVIASSPPPVFIVRRASLDMRPGATNPLQTSTAVLSDYAELAPAAGNDAQPVPAQTAVPAPAQPSAKPSSVFEASVTDPSTPATNNADSEPQPQLDSATRKTLEHTPAGIDTPQPEQTEHVQVEHEKHKNTRKPTDPSQPDAKAGPVNASVETGKLGFDMQYQLQQAYASLTAGDTEAAIHDYQSVLDNDHDNKQALFGIATAYHRVGQIDQARPFYSRLLKLDPGNRDALNNFMALAADEAPQEALAELQALQKRNPDFSPIPAQIAFVEEKLGQSDKAIENMLHAVEMQPENITYRYNLAVMYDKAGQKKLAIPLYQQVLEAAYRGVKIPSSLDRVQERLIFLSSNSK